MHTQRHKVYRSVQTNERSVTVSSSTLCQVPGLPTHAVTVPLKHRDPVQHPTICFEFVCTLDPVYTTQLTTSTRPRIFTFVSVSTHRAATLKHRGERKPQGESEVKFGLYEWLNAQFSIRWGSYAQKKKAKKNWLKNLGIVFVHTLQQRKCLNRSRLHMEFCAHILKCTQNSVKRCS